MTRSLKLARLCGPSMEVASCVMPFCRTGWRVLRKVFLQLYSPGNKLPNWERAPERPAFDSRFSRCKRDALSRCLWLADSG